jgi:ATP-dependent Clp protease ATP-binding subunit ClpA
MRIERFTEKAQEAFQEAQEIMHEQHHTQLDVEHIFLAMLRQRDGLAGRALDRLGVDTEMVSQRVERELEKSPKVYGQYGYGNQVYITPRTQRLVKRAEEEATRLNDQYVGIEKDYASLAVQDAAKATVTEIKPHVAADDPKSIVLPLPELEAGKYTVKFRVLSVDGHVVDSSYDFTVKSKAPQK